MEKSLPLVFISSKTKKAKIIENLLRKNSTLAALLGQGVRIRNPHKPAGAGVGIAGFIGNRFPTKFHFKGHDPSVDVTRDAHLNSHVRITFETDAANDYFNREDEPGKFTLYRIVGGKSVAATNYQRPRLHNGLAHLSLVLPDDAKVGDELTFLSLVTDPSRIEPLRNMFVLNVIAERQTKSGGSGGNGGSGSDTGTDKGSKGGGKGQTQDSQLDIPEPFHVYEKDWDKHEFNKFTVMHVKKPPDAKPDEERYDYYINMDNVYVQSFMKEEPKRAKSPAGNELFDFKALRSFV